MAIDGLCQADAEHEALRNMTRLHSRFRKLIADLGAETKVAIMPWPETHDRKETSDIRAALVSAMQQSAPLAQALNDVVQDYLQAFHHQLATTSSAKEQASLLSYVIEEVAAFVYLCQEASPLEVYPGEDLPFMRRLSAGEFTEVFPYRIENRSHLSLSLVPLQEGSIRDGVPSDWPEIERLIRAWPTHFVEAAIPLVRQTFLQHQTILCVADHGNVLGFMIWRTDGRELELCWMAVDPHYTRRGIGGAILESVLLRRTTESRVFGETATTDSVIPNTNFDGSSYTSTHRFFAKFGFTLGSRHESYWGPRNHMVIIEKRYEH